MYVKNGLNKKKIIDLPYKGCQTCSKKPQQINRYCPSKCTSFQPPFLDKFCSCRKKNVCFNCLKNDKDKFCSNGKFRGLHLTKLPMADTSEAPCEDDQIMVACEDQTSQILVQEEKIMVVLEDEKKIAASKDDKNVASPEEIKNEEGSKDNVEMSTHKDDKINSMVPAQPDIVSDDECFLMTQQLELIVCDKV